MNASDSQPPAKKPYRLPVLEVYGSVREMTQGIPSGSGMNDNAMTNNKTG